VTLTATDLTIQSTTTYTLKFFNSVPLNAGCQVEVTFPSELTFDSDSLQLVTGSGGIIGSSRSLDFSYDEGDSSVKVTDACNSYSSSGLQFNIIYDSLTNPNYVDETSALTIVVRDENNQQVMTLSESSRHYGNSNYWWCR